MQKGFTASARSQVVDVCTTEREVNQEHWCQHDVVDEMSMQVVFYCVCARACHRIHHRSYSYNHFVFKIQQHVHKPPVTAQVGFINGANGSNSKTLAASHEPAETVALLQEAAEAHKREREEAFTR